MEPAEHSRNVLKNADLLLESRKEVLKTHEPGWAKKIEWNCLNTLIIQYRFDVLAGNAKT